MRGLAVKALVPMALLLSFGVIKWLNPWQELYEVHSRAYLVYHLARLLFLLVFPILVYAAGRLIMPSFESFSRFNGFDRLDHFLLSSAAGAGLISVTTVVLAAFNLLRVEVTIPIALFFSFLAAYRINELGPFWEKGKEAWRALMASSPHWWSIRRLVFFLLLALLTVFVMDVVLKRGVVPHLTSNDVVGSYIPCCEDILLEEHGFWPTIWYIQYYFAKGIGLQFFGMSLTDLFSGQLVNLYLFGLAGLVLFQCLRKMDVPSSWLLVALILYFMSPIAEESFNKNHVALSSYIIIFYFICVRLLQAPREHQWMLFRPLLVLSVSNVVFFPLSAFFCLGILGLSAVLSLITGRVKSLTALAWSAAAVLVTLCLVYAFNYWQSGLMDMATSFFDRYINREVFSQWNSEMVLLLQRHFNQGEGYFSLVNLTAWANWQAALSQLVGSDYYGFLNVYSPIILIGLCLLLLLVLIGEKLLNNARFGLAENQGAQALLLSLGVLAMVLVGQVFYVHGALGRATTFRCVFFILGTAGVLHFLIKLMPWQNIRAFARSALPLLFIAGALIFPQVLGKPLFHTIESPNTWVGFLTGNQSYLDIVNEHWEVSDYWHVKKMKLPGRKIVSLNFIAGGWSLPREEGFLRPLQNVYMRDLPTVLYGSPEKALAVLRKHGIEHAIVDLGKRKMITALAPLFSEEALRRYARVLWRGGRARTIYVISFRPDEGAPLEDYPQFFSGYRKALLVRGHQELYEFGSTLLGQRNEP